jgi:hypothetical protein
LPSSTLEQNRTYRRRGILKIQPQYLQSVSARWTFSPHAGQGLARYDKIDTDAHQENRNKEKQILYGCKHSNLHCDVVGQKDIKAKNNQGAADHKETSFDS